MESTPVETLGPASLSASAAPNARDFALFAYCYGDRHALLPQLTTAFVSCGGWVLDRRTLSASAMEFRFEIQLNGILDLYAALAVTSLELTRSSHATLTDLCTCRKNIHDTKDPNQILTLRLEISFLADVTLHSILMTGSSLA